MKRIKTDECNESARRARTGSSPSNRAWTSGNLSRIALTRIENTRIFSRESGRLKLYISKSYRSVRCLNCITAHNDAQQIHAKFTQTWRAIGNGGLQCYSGKNWGSTCNVVATNTHRRSSSLAQIQRPQVHRRLTRRLAGRAQRAASPTTSFAISWADRGRGNLPG